MATYPTSIKYGTGGADGYMSRDQVCLTRDNSTCLKDYNMLSVFMTKDLKSMKADGILGLAPSQQKTRASVFINELFYAGIIDKRVFSFYVTRGTYSSRVTLGGYDLKYAA